MSSSPFSTLQWLPTSVIVKAEILNACKVLCDPLLPSHTSLTSSPILQFSSVLPRAQSTRLCCPSCHSLNMTDMLLPQAFALIVPSAWNSPAPFIQYHYFSLCSLFKTITYLPLPHCTPTIPNPLTPFFSHPTIFLHSIYYCLAY